MNDSVTGRKSAIKAIDQELQKILNSEGQDGVLLQINKHVASMRGVQADLNYSTLYINRATAMLFSKNDAPKINDEEFLMQILQRGQSE